MVDTASLEPEQQWQADRRILGPLLLAVGILALGIGVAAWFGVQRRSDGFSFESYEGDGSAARVEDAKLALEKLVPVGSKLTDYDHFFQNHGGECGIITHMIHYPNTAICSYDHGFLVSAGWRYIIDYDLVTFRSKHTELNFGLTGM